MTCWSLRTFDNKKYMNFLNDRKIIMLKIQKCTAEELYTFLILFKIEI